MYTSNWKYNKSLAEQKRVWKGEEGQFATNDLRSWYRVVDSTRIRQSLPLLDRVLA